MQRNTLVQVAAKSDPPKKKTKKQPEARGVSEITTNAGVPQGAQAAAVGRPPVQSVWLKRWFLVLFGSFRVCFFFGFMCFFFVWGGGGMVVSVVSWGWCFDWFD